MTYCFGKHTDLEGEKGNARNTSQIGTAVSVLFASLLLSACAGARYHSEGLDLLQTGRIDAGIASLKKATELESTNQQYRIDYLMQRDRFAESTLRNADQARSLGKLAEARELYSRALALDAGNVRATQALAALERDSRSILLLNEGERFLQEGRVDAARERAARVLAEQPNNQRAAELSRDALGAKAVADAARERVREMRSVMATPVTLQFRDTPMRSVFEALFKTAGINILLDRDVKADSRVTIFVKDVSVEDAIDLILMQNQLEKRIVNSNTLLVYAATANKQSEYQELTVRSFRVTNSDLKYLAGMLKTMLKLKDISADERSNLLVIRDTAETLRIAEKLISLHDEPDPEVMLEVEVLEISEGRASNLGILPPSSITIGTPSTSGAGSLTIGQLRALTVEGLTVSPLSGTINFKLQDNDAKILASPRIRARNKEKAKIMIGDRVPTIINNVTPVNGGSSVVTGTVTYQDVGLKLEFEPQVYASNDVGIKINLEVSNIAREFTDLQGSRSYQIGTRNASTFLRLADGETQVLGGLITDEERNTVDKIPGLGHLPVVGRLFGNNGMNKTRTEIVLAITPRIVRSYAAITQERGNVFSGTATGLRDRQILGDPVGAVSMPNSTLGNGRNAAPSSQTAGRPTATPLSNGVSAAPASSQVLSGGIPLGIPTAVPTPQGTSDPTGNTSNGIANPANNTQALPSPPPMIRR